MSKSKASDNSRYKQNRGAGYLRYYKPWLRVIEVLLCAILPIRPLYENNTYDFSLYMREFEFLVFVRFFEHVSY